MQKPVSEVMELGSKPEKTRFNFNKLQAVICMVASAALSIGLIIWLVRTFS
jgi:hypothetical protein